MKVVISNVLFLIAGCAFSQDRIAITIDDLPCTNCESLESAREVNESLVETFKTYQVPAIGFVNESKLYTDQKADPGKINFLRAWLSNDLNLGNHTFSHIYIDTATIEEYEADILKGEIITKRLIKEYGKELKYFRHPQLRTGATPGFKARLDKVLSDHNYTVAPVTMDNDEYIYAYCYHKAKMNGETALMRLIAYDYINYMKSIFRHYKRVSQEFLGYNLSHILLLHANELNADYLPFLLDILKNSGYVFVSLDEALTDKAYTLPEMHSERGISWIYRWQLADGDTIEPQPDISQRVRSWFNRFRNSNEVTDFQWFIGPQNDIDSILNAIEDFSRFYRSRDYDNLAKSYTADGKIFPNGTGIIEGQDAIKERWIIPQDRAITSHIVTPVEIQVVGETAYDYGYYEGETTFSNGGTSRWNGKYVIVWKKENGNWKIYLDIWNRL